MFATASKRNHIVSALTRLISQRFIVGLETVAARIVIVIVIIGRVFSCFVRSGIGVASRSIMFACVTGYALAESLRRPDR